MTSTTLPTRNTEWGFFGTMAQAGYDAPTAWDTTSTAIRAATGASAEGVRDFLDARDGRFFADDVHNESSKMIGTADARLREAINAAVARWQGWHIGRAESRKHGIPYRLPYLTGWVHHYAIISDMSTAA